MPGKETVFISYRRSDSAAEAQQLRDQLAKVFHPETVFFDAGMPLGTDFPDEIAQAVARALAVLVVIGPGWLDSMKARASGAAKTDWVFEEVKAALSRRARGDKLLVVPLLRAGTAMPEEGQLPSALVVMPAEPAAGCRVQRDGRRPVPGFWRARPAGPGAQHPHHRPPTLLGLEQGFPDPGMTVAAIYRRRCLQSACFCRMSGRSTRR